MTHEKKTPGENAFAWIFWMAAAIPLPHLCADYVVHGDMSQPHTIKGPSPCSSHQRGPYIQWELSLQSEVCATSPFVDTLMQLIRKGRCVPGNEDDIEIALREALANAVIHGNHEDNGKRVFVSCCCGTDEVSIVIKDEGQGFDIGEVPDPTAPKNIKSSHGRGIYLMKTLMDEVRFEQGGAVVYLRKSARKQPSLEDGG